VTLWCRLEHDATATVSEATVGRSLRVLHEALALCQVELPSFRFALERARAVLSSDARIPALAKDDRMLLCTAFDDLLAQLDDRKFLQRALHGEPHDGNHLLTPSGLRWIDFEGACLGPPEWDLAFLPDGARAAFTDVDLDLLALLEVLDSVRVATWCWVQAHFPEMRAHGEHHLELVRTRWRNTAEGSSSRGKVFGDGCRDDAAPACFTTETSRRRSHE
jgi:aminoglycoside phosphotransferase (APT) family kinase protein